MMHLYLALSLFRSAALQDAGFEESDPLRAWKAWIYKEGRDPVIRADSSVAHEGRASLLIAAEDPADVALGQTMALPAGGVFRATAWIKTEGLAARDRTEVGAALHVQTPDGGAIAAGPSAFGTTAWRHAGAVFRVPPGGEVKIVLFFIGFGKGTGKVWFDDVRVEPIAVSDREAVRIRNEKLTKLPIDGKQCGQFIEPLCDLIPSMLAQQVANTSFEDEPPWRFAYRRAVDRRPRPWYPDGAAHLARYALDEERPFNGKRSQRIELAAAGCWAGISQDGFSTQEGASYRLRLHLRGRGSPPVRAWLHGGGGTIAGPVELGAAGESWGPAEGVLRASRTIENATLTIGFKGPGTLWVDRVYLIAQDAVLGLWRPDVAAAVRAMKAGVIRFGGSAMEAYEWDRCVGPWDARAPFPSPFWGGIEENFVGVEEFVAFCREVGAEPLVCIRWTGKKPADAAAQVEYFNGAPETKWGQVRARNGRAEPWRVRYWQVGNEVGGREYDASLAGFCEAMRAVDPSIKILSSFPSDDTLRLGGGRVDYLCPHHYGCADLGAMESDFRRLAELIRGSGSPRPVRVAITEWNTTAGDWELGRGSLQTLSNALSCARYHNLLHRHADLAEIAVRSNLVDSFCSGTIVTGPGWLYVAPTYHAQRLYTRAAGSWPLRIERAVELPWHVQEPDLSAALSEDGKTLRLYGVNSTARKLNLDLELEGFAGGVSAAAAHVLRATGQGLWPSVEAMNTRDDPAAVGVATLPCPASGNRFPLAFEPFSLTLYELELAKSGR